MRATRHAPLNYKRLELPIVVAITFVMGLMALWKLGQCNDGEVFNAPFLPLYEAVPVAELFIEFPPPPRCTKDQLAKIETQLPADPCHDNAQEAWNGQCSFSVAASCPHTPWLKDYFARAVELEQGTSEIPFKSVVVGCSTAVDAVVALSMGTRNPRYNVDTWKKTLAKGRPVEFSKPSCAQYARVFNVSANLKKSTESREAQLYCIEPETTTYNQLVRTAKELGWNDALIVEHAMVSLRPLVMNVSKHVPFGTEINGIDDIDCSKNGNQTIDCVKIPVHTLNGYVNNRFPSPSPSDDIHFLSINVDGHDVDVLRGGDEVLRRVHYLEFEYNWKGPWRRQHLTETMDMMVGHGFQCYWPGRDGHIWRITGCWLDHYKFRYLAKVACVNPRLAKPLADDMERRFLETLEIHDLVYQVDNNESQKKAQQA